MDDTGFQKKGRESVGVARQYCGQVGKQDNCRVAVSPSTLVELVQLAKHRWIIEPDYQELKQEHGLGHYEGRGWRGFHHHATLCIAAYGFLVAERSRFSPSARIGNLGLPTAEPPRLLAARFAAFVPSGIVHVPSLL